MSATRIWKTTENTHRCTPETAASVLQWPVTRVRVEEVTHQTIAGFGGAFNEVGWEAIQKLDTQAQRELMQALFSQEGAALNLCRTPIGASDFGLDAYSLNDHDGDFEMAHFSIARDKDTLIPFIHAAQAVNPELRLCGCPWSPPAWMKNTKNMCCGGELTDTPENLRAYAVYFRKYIQTYQAEGVKLTDICIQNETDVINVYPTSTMEAEMMRRFMRGYLIPELMQYFAKPLPVGLWAGTIRDVPGYADAVVNDDVLRQFVTGIGYQYSCPEVVGDSWAKHPQIPLYHTECPCHNGANSWAEAREIFADMADYLENGCVNYTYWNMVLNETGFSTWNWQQNAMITADRVNGKWFMNHEYYVMKHFSGFVKPGAVRLGVSGTSDSFRVLAFRNPCGEIVVVAGNLSEENSTLEITVDGKTCWVNTEAGSFVTVIL